MRIVDLLEHGDRRQLGRVAEVIALVEAAPERIAEVAAALDAADPAVRMRAADALEKLTRAHPERLGDYKSDLLHLAACEQQMEVKWHVAQMLPRLPLSAPERRRAIACVRQWLDDPSRIVRTCALESMVELGAPDAAELLTRAARDGSPAERARARILASRASAAPRSSAPSTEARARYRGAARTASSPPRATRRRP